MSLSELDVLEEEVSETKQVAAQPTPQMHVAYNPVLRGMHCHDLSKEYGAPINQLVTHSISQPVDQPIYQSVFTKRLPSAQLLLSAHRVWR